MWTWRFFRAIRTKSEPTPVLRPTFREDHDFTPGKNEARCDGTCNTPQGYGLPLDMVDWRALGCDPVPSEEGDCGFYACVDPQLLRGKLAVAEEDLLILRPTEYLSIPAQTHNEYRQVDILLGLCWMEGVIYTHEDDICRGTALTVVALAGPTLPAGFEDTPYLWIDLIVGGTGHAIDLEKFDKAIEFFAKVKEEFEHA